MHNITCCISCFKAVSFLPDALLDGGRLRVEGRGRNPATSDIPFASVVSRQVVSHRKLYWLGRVEEYFVQEGGGGQGRANLTISDLPVASASSRQLVPHRML